MNDKSYGYGSGMSASYTTTQGSGQATGTASFGAAPASKPAQDTGPLIKDTTTQSFMPDVIEASRETTILVDFWAPWCGPCKQLTPILEKAVTEAKGRVKLVKLNIDDHPEIPGQMGIQSIPAVVAFKDGRPVDGFMGAQPESQIKAFIDKNGSEPAADPLEEAAAQANGLLEEGQPGEALQIFGAILQQDPDFVPAMVGLGSCFLALEEIERARGVLDAMPEEAFKQKDALAFKASLELAEQSADLGDLADLQAKLDTNPEDTQARFDLAIALNGKNKRDEAVDHLIAIIKNDRDWNDDGARKQLLQFFESWGVMDPASVNGRRKLSSVLFS
ncbi:thioredoxin [uncultured Cohaesibacter sp.]|uniref:thioredoxin n=1 Tax=uncultured Cohaesibacter sp. TaxID=1002546 RepID=UPI0029C6DA1C|nr:thioredoxin [uncultured Cohaesibacter sp.]